MAKKTTVTEPAPEPADEKTAVVGEDYALPGHCLVAHPDGTVVTSSRSYRFTEPGEYRVIPNADPDKVTVVTVSKAEPEPEPEDSPQEAGHTDE